MCLECRVPENLFSVKWKSGQLFSIRKTILLSLTQLWNILDVADAYNGTKYNFSLDTDYYFNPLDADIERIINDTEMLIVEKSQLMQGICEHIMDGQMESVHATIIDRSIRSLYRKLKNKIIEAKERTMPVMRALYDEIALQKEEETRELLLALELFVDGSYNIFNHQTNVKKHSRLTVYGMEGLSGNKKLSRCFNDNNA